jgi:hypothetical protein
MICLGDCWQALAEYGWEDSRLPLRKTLKGIPETVGVLVTAAEEKYWEGRELMLAGKLGACIYLMGYAAEIYLKTACFRVGGIQLADVVGPKSPAFKSALRIGHGVFPAILDESCHSLLFWANLLRHGRRRGGLIPWSPRFRSEFTSCTRRLYSTWWVEMRYRPDRARPADARNVLDWAGWLRMNYPALWR